MKAFMDENFLLKTETAKTLFAAAKEMPIFDWHCHLSPQEIYENRQPENITQLWLYGDHYKWRAMRSYGSRNGTSRATRTITKNSAHSRA